jgi:glyceraldehyde 3-phosphate dehydrogenase
MSEKVKVGISGFGRIGRAVARIICGGLADNDLELVAVNDLSEIASLAHLFKYDTVMKQYSGSVGVTPEGIVINDQLVRVYSIKDPKQLSWGELGVDIVLESTGAFTTKVGKDGKPGYGDHITAGARKVVLSSPAKDEIELMVVRGVNDNLVTKDTVFVSNASCTTNCLAPLAKVLHERFGIVEGMMTTVHAVTNDQRVADQIHKDLRRARAAAENIIPTSTGAARSIGKIIPELEGKLDGCSLRVPIPDGSIVDLVVKLETEVTAEEVNNAVKAAAQGRMSGIIDYCNDPIVSSDIVGNPASCVFDSLLTNVLGKRGKLVKVMAWYDNEWAYSMRTVELMDMMAAMMQ